MKINMLIIYLFVLNLNCYADYSSLKAYKQDVKNQVKIEKASLFKRSNPYFVIEFMDINRMDTYSLKQKYGFELTQCIADGICIFKFDDNQSNLFQFDEIIKKEANIKQIKSYKPYEFKAF